jgi:predicted glycosyltransferase
MPESGPANRLDSPVSTGGPDIDCAAVRVWVDMTNVAHPVVLRPLIELLEANGHEVQITARPLSHTLELLDAWGHPYTAVGRYGGASKARKARAAMNRIARLGRFAQGRRFDYALAHASADLPPVCRVLRIPNTTMFDYEWATLQHNVICRLASRVLVPDAIPPDRLARYGARPPKLVRFPGLKEEYYLADFEPDRAALERLGVPKAEPVCVVRTPPSYALYLGGSENALLPPLLRHLDRQGCWTVVLTRTPAQRDAVNSLRLERMVAPEQAQDGRSLVALADALVSAGGTMNREAAVLGTPVWSIFEGPLGGVDELLIREGRMRMLRDPQELKIERRPKDAFERRVRRDPAELLRLAVPL